MIDSFQSPLQRLSRAKKHINTLDRRINKFFKKQPYATIVENDIDGINKLHKIILTKQFPVGFTDLAVEAIEGLRSALDQATFAACVASGQSDPRQAYFPISNTAAELDNVIKGRCKDVPPDVITLCRSFNPYKGGNDLIFALNRLCNINKHCIIIPIGITVYGAHFKQMVISGNCSIMKPTWNREKNEVIFARTAPDTKFKYDINFSLYVAFGEHDIVGSQPAIPVLRKIAQEVNRIVLTIQSIVTHETTT